MAPLPKTPVTFRFGPVDTRTGKKHLRPGQLTEMVNAKQESVWDFEPRRGYGREPFDPETGAITGPVDAYVYTDTRLVRDGVGVNWVFDPELDQWKNYGAVKRPFPGSDQIMPPDAYCQPCTVRVGGNDWTFALRADGYTRTVKDAATGEVLVVPTKVDVADIVHLCAVSDGTTIFLFYVTGSTTIGLHRYAVASPGGSATATTYQTVSGTAFNGVDATVRSGSVYVLATSFIPDDVYHYTHSVLDPGTGQASASPAPVTATAACAVGSICTGPSWLEGGPSDELYYSLWRPTGTSADSAVYVTRITRATLAVVSASAAISTRTFASTRNPTCGYLDESTVPVVFASWNNEDPIGYGTTFWRTVRSVGFATPSESMLGFHCWIASKPFQLGDDWYLFTGSTEPNQNAFHLREALADTGQVLAQMEHRLAGGLFHNRDILDASRNDQYPAAYAPIVDGTDVYLGAISDGAAVRLRMDFAAEYAPGVALGSKALIPGPIPYVFGAADSPREIVPLMAPELPAEYAGGAGTVGIQFVYRFIDSRGQKDRSSPSPVFQLATLPTALLTPTLRHTLTGARAQIEIYVTDTGSTTPVLRYVRENDPTADRIEVLTALVDNVDPEAVYTTGGALAAAPPPACRNLLVWRNRVIASGTPRLGQIMPSLEMAVNEGPRFNSILASYWPDTRTQVLRLEPISWDACAVMSETALGVISGNGPNGKGQGPYRVQTLPTKKGIKNPRAAAQGAAGVYLQSIDDRYFLIPGFSVEDISAGATAYTSPVSAALHNHAEHKVLFFLEDGKVLAFDYERGLPEQPRGQWSRYSSAGLLRAYGAVMIGDVPEHIEADGTRRTYQGPFTDSSPGGEVEYDMVLASGELAVFDLGRQFRLDQAIVHGEFIGACDLTAQFEFDNGSAAPLVWGPETRTISAAPFQTMIKPSKGDRIQSVKFILTVSCLNGGARFSGLTLVVQDRGNVKFPNTVQRMAG